MEELIQQIKIAISSNEFFQGGFILMVFGALLAWSRSLPPLIKKLFLRFYTIDIEVRDLELVFWLSKWLASMPYSKRCRHLAGIMSRNQDEVPTPPGAPSSIILTPGFGNHFFQFNGRWFWLVRTLEDSPGGVNLLRMENVSIRTYGRNRKHVRIILDALEQFIEAERSQKAQINIMDSYGNWNQLREINPRPLSSILLPEGMMDMLLDDINGFMDKREWYYDRGLPYRRGYLLYGPPGNGKSSLVQAVASSFGLPLYLLSTRGEDVTDQRLIEAMGRLPARSIVLIEDADSVIPKRNRKSNKGVSLSGVLNAIDGPTASEGRILFVTTNFIDLIDSAILRVGRLDLHIEFPDATHSQAKGLYKRFYDDEMGAKRFADALPTPPPSMATLQEILFKSTDPILALRTSVASNNGLHQTMNPAAQKALTCEQTD